MRYLVFLAIWISSTSVFAADYDDGHFLVVHQEADPRFINSIERVGDCKIPGEPIPLSKVRVPWKLYPFASLAKHEQGDIRMQFIFDRDWCVRKVSVLQSSGYWRLDEVSLKFAMTLKWKPSVIKEYVDGEPSVQFPITWRMSEQSR
jgi:outer membrane biosynthesis protein TonB